MHCWGTVKLGVGHTKPTSSCAVTGGGFGVTITDFISIQNQMAEWLAYATKKFHCYVRLVLNCHLEFRGIQKSLHNCIRYWLTALVHKVKQKARSTFYSSEHTILYSSSSLFNHLQIFQFQYLLQIVDKKQVITKFSIDGMVCLTI